MPPEDRITGRDLSPEQATFVGSFFGCTKRLPTRIGKILPIHWNLSRGYSGDFLATSVTFREVLLARKRERD
jgi:hypothetical protein